jgi:hypothetical protein
VKLRNQSWQETRYSSAPGEIADRLLTTLTNAVPPQNEHCPPRKRIERVRADSEEGKNLSAHFFIQRVRLSV